MGIMSLGLKAVLNFFRPVWGVINYYIDSPILAIPQMRSVGYIYSQMLINRSSNEDFRAGAAIGIGFQLGSFIAQL